MAWGGCGGNVIWPHRAQLKEPLAAELCDPYPQVVDTCCCFYLGAEKSEHGRNGENAYSNRRDCLEDSSVHHSRIIDI